jgi:hypothetical protein
MGQKRDPLTGQNLGRVFIFRFGHLHAEHFCCYQVKLPNLKLKTQLKQLLGSLPLVIALPGYTHTYLTYIAVSVVESPTLSSVSDPERSGCLCKNLKMNQWNSMAIQSLQQGRLTEGEGSVQLTSLYYLV